MHKKLVASFATEYNALEMLISFDCTESREDVGHEDNPVIEWEYHYEVAVKFVEFVFMGTSVKIMKYNELDKKQQDMADFIAESEAQELFNKY
jgi:hypothetical protein